jgi:hypothetical protein
MALDEQDARASSSREAPEAEFALLIRNLRASVSTHRIMFEKLLFQHDPDPLPLELAELLEDIANTYLDFSERIGSLHFAGIKD